MNYLAHLYLSPDIEDLTIGSLLGDFVKGPIKKEASLFNQGIMLHRKLDSFTDNNMVVRRSKSLIGIENRRYAGIIIDLFYDYFLANNWSLFHRLSLPCYAGTIYRMLEQRYPELPENFQKILPNMIRNDWLTSYGCKNHLEMVLKKVGQRLKKPISLERSLLDLSQNYTALENDFFAYIPLARQFCWEYNQQLCESGLGCESALPK